ncbi:restriction endonuclease subunit S [Winogradskyella sp. MH6]|uniref:restriction endonuclease subunit S n=1 Tax=Winogradskyella sp. MH6 TaxID=2929510 RepID=UPI001FB496CF|nr:restriction endonuclease subunit S [Winogradskyella sp. MH6]
MMEEWKEVKLGELLKIKYGKDHKKLDEGNVPLMGTGGLMRYVNDYLYDEESILIPRKGTLSSLFFMDKPFWTVDTMFWSKVNKKLVNPKYLYFYLKTINLASYNVGSTIPSLTTNLLNNLKITIYQSKETQRKIASILSAYDDLIENNLKRIKLLEEQAQLTYEEWFVRFKFPGHETVKFDEETGLPEGWEKVKLVECANLIMGQSPKSEFYNNEEKGLPFHQGVKDYGFRFPTNSSWSTQGNRIAKENSILFSVRAPVGRLNVALEEIIIGRGLAAINHKKGWNSLLLYQLQNIFYEDNLMGGGAIYNSVTKKDVQDIEIISATKDIHIKYNDFSSNVDKQIKNLTKQNLHLKEARDILLPRLMSGMIDVEKLDVGSLKYEVNDSLGMVAEETSDFKK